tara:strand:- start:455 stop:955 length:501 start_codon:yes stop_codon:yes gene_type:complete
MMDVYGLSPIHLEINDNYQRATFISKHLYDDLVRYIPSYSTSNKHIEIPSIIMNGKKVIKIEFLRSFFEDEGSISAKGIIAGDLKNKKIIYQIGHMLRELGFKFGICSYEEYTGKMYKIYLYKNEENLKKFLELKLFDIAEVTKGENKGKKKIEVLKEAIKRFKNP